MPRANPNRQQVLAAAGKDETDLPTAADFDADLPQDLDARGRPVTVHGPSVILGLKSVKFGQSYLIPAFKLTGFSDADLIFEIKEGSAFTSIWDGYPIRQQWKAGPDDQVLEKAA